MTTSVGVEELRRNFDDYMGRANAGETIQITRWGKPIALLGPRPPATGQPADSSKPAAQAPPST